MKRLEITLDGETIEHELTPAEVAAIQADRDAAIATLAAATAEEGNATTLRDRAVAALANLEAAWDGWGALTAAQKDAALKLNVRVTIAIARLVLRRLDKT